MTNNQFIAYVASIAKSDWASRKIMLPSVVIAQAILESGWGKSELATKANALFGIKNHSGWKGKVYVKNATEQRADGTYYVVSNTEWRAYDNWEDSIIDHNDYIKTAYNGKVLRYAKIHSNTDYKDVCNLLKECGYATSLTYPQKLISLIEQYGLTKYDGTEITYTQADMMKDLRTQFGLSSTATAKEILAKTVKLKKNSTYNKTVLIVQKRLIALGISCGSCGADGYFGKDTVTAVKAYQKEYKTGFVDGYLSAKGNTWKSLLGLI